MANVVGIEYSGLWIMRVKQLPIRDNTDWVLSPFAVRRWGSRCSVVDVELEHVAICINALVDLGFDCIDRPAVEPGRWSGRRFRERFHSRKDAALVIATDSQILGAAGPIDRGVGSQWNGRLCCPATAGRSDSTGADSQSGDTTAARDIGFDRVAAGA